jgi:hypothetical protein
MDLSRPMRWTAAPGDRYMSMNGTFLSPNYLNSCLNQPVPSNVSRSLFPVQNGYAIFDLYNQGNIKSNPNNTFAIHLYLPHLWYQYLAPTDYNTGVQNTYKKAQTLWSWDGWQNFVQGKQCSIPINMTEMIVDKDGNRLKASDLVGLNVTLAIQIMDVRYYGVFEEVDEARASSL